MGSGVGDPFGPSCNKGDVMGCGVLFPRDFESKSDSDEEGELVVRLVENQGDTEEYETDSGEEEEWWRPDVKQGDKVQVDHANCRECNIGHVLFALAGLLHEEWEDDWEEGGDAAQGRLLPHCGDDELTGEGQGGPQTSLWVDCGAVVDSVCTAS